MKKNMIINNRCLAYIHDNPDIKPLSVVIQRCKDWHDPSTTNGISTYWPEMIAAIEGLRLKYIKNIYI